MLRVGVNGYGTIGKRVVDAVRAQPDMTVVGAAKRSPSHGADRAHDRGIDLYAANEEGATAFADAGLPVAGRVPDLVDSCDVIVDATPSGVGETYVPLYRRLDTPAIVQGGEPAGCVDGSFTARTRYDAVADGEADVVRVVSCNTTGLARTLAPLADRFAIDRARATLIRRGGDPTQTDRGPIDDILPDPVALPSHHGTDLATVLPEVTVDTVAVRVPATRMHVQALNVSFRDPPDPADVRRCLTESARVFPIPDWYGADGAGALREIGRDFGRPRGDLWETCLWTESIALTDGELYLFQAIDQQCNVVPENIDAIRAITGATDRATSVHRTNDALGIGLPHRSVAASAEPATT